MIYSHLQLIPRVEDYLKPLWEPKWLYYNENQFQTTCFLCQVKLVATIWIKNGWYITALNEPIINKEVRNRWQIFLATIANNLYINSDQFGKNFQNISCCDFSFCSQYMAVIISHANDTILLVGSKGIKEMNAGVDIWIHGNGVY